MFKVLEVHSAYISTALTVIVHLLAAFYFLYILKVSYGGLLPGTKESKVIWYQAPRTKQPAATPPPSAVAYQQPQETSPTQAPVAESAIPLAVNPERMGRSRQQRRAAWSKAAAQEEEPQPITAATIVDAISTQQAAQRHAHAVYTKQEAVANSVAAQMREITQGRMRDKIFSALKIVCSLNRKDYVSPAPVDTTIMTSLVINQKGEIIAVEVLKSTGTQALDEHIVMLLQQIKKVATPPSRNPQELHTQTFACRVQCQTGSNHLEFSYTDSSGIHIM